MKLKEIEESRQSATVLMTNDKSKKGKEGMRGIRAMGNKCIKGKKL